VAAPLSRLEQRRAQHKRYKEDVEASGKPFYPFAMFHDTVMSFIVVGVIIGLTIVWKYSIPGDDGTVAGWLGPLSTEKADPGTTNFIPRPDWYFYFLFYLLRIFKWPDSVILATVGIPTILLILLISLPFLDLRRERRLSRRPVAVVAAVLVAISMGVLTYRGATARESLGSENVRLVDVWAQRQNFVGNEQAIQGARLFAGAGCQQCHIYLGAGSINLGAPELSDIGQSNQGVDYFSRYVADPSQFGNNVMPKYGEDFSQEQLRAIGEFLNASKGAAGED
jgi:menaquinol-cytochrome c reductase cytochrome b/c subunit